MTFLKACLIIKLANLVVARYVIPRFDPLLQDKRISAYARAYNLSFSV